MELIGGFGIDIVDGRVLYQCPVCNPKHPYNLGSFQKVIHIKDKDNDGLADIAGLSWNCPNENCGVQVTVPYEPYPQYDWGRKLTRIFADKEAMFKKISLEIKDLKISIKNSPDFIEDDFVLTSDPDFDKKFKVSFAINSFQDYDVYVSTQLQDDLSDWGAVPEGWVELDCIMVGVVKAKAKTIDVADVKHICKEVKWL